MSVTALAVSGKQHQRGNSAAADVFELEAFPILPLNRFLEEARIAAPR